MKKSCKYDNIVAGNSTPHLLISSIAVTGVLFLVKKIYFPHVTVWAYMYILLCIGFICMMMFGVLFERGKKMASKESEKDAEAIELKEIESAHQHAQKNEGSVMEEISIASHEVSL